MTSERRALRNLRILAAYDGTDFFGWQRQPDQPTVQGCLEAAIERITRQVVNVIGAGRTDAGVHAAGQVASVRIQSAIPCENLAKALNDILPDTIRICTIQEASPSFHARYDAVGKLYRYRILNRDVCPPFLARFVHHYAGPLDFDAMARAAQTLAGEHDFTSFAAARPPDEKAGERGNAAAAVPSGVRRIFSSWIVWKPRTSLVVYELRGSGFLRHMVRNITGALIEVGRGVMPPEEISRILAARDRAAAGPTAPARGLCLMRVEY